jgi:hypothetical protein
MQNIPVEEWRPIPGFEGHYDVSSHGRIRSHKRGKTRIRKISIHNKDRHRFVMLLKDAKSYQLVVARLVLLAFVGPPPSDKHVACHEKGGNANDYLWRLRWDTVRENNRDTVRHGNHRSPCGGAHHFASLDERKVRAIKARLVRGESQNALARKFNVTQGTISRISTGDTWKHVTSSTRKSS